MAVSDGSGNCCDCGQYANCSCSGVACSLVCRSKAGDAELCGYDEFGEPSTPPRRFKFRTTMGTMTISRFLTPDCGELISVGASIECRSKSGTAELIGFSEFTSPSSPPKKYLKKTASGRLYSCSFGGSLASCHGDNVVSQRNEYHVYGEAVYDPDTGSLTNNMKFDRYNVNSPGGSCAAAAAGVSLIGSETLNSDFPPASSINFPGGSVACTEFQPSAPLTWSDSPTERAYGAAGDCVSCAGTTTAPDRGVMTTPIKAVLSDEDTEENAIARAIAEIGSWNSTGTCDDHTSFMEERTSGFEFDFRFGQARVVIPSGLVIAANYEARMQIGRRVLGSSDPYTPQSDIVISFTAEDASHTSDWEDLPASPGWEYAVIGVEVYGEISELIEDNWFILEDSSMGLPESCFPSIEDDISDRYINGEPVSWPFGSTVPSDAYGAGAETDVEPTARTTEGKDECIGPDGEGKYNQTNGTVTESLSSEDTEDAAEARAADAIEDWGSEGLCSGRTAFRTQRTTGFTFGWRKAQVRVQWTAVSGKTYQVKVRFARRVLGSSGPFLFYSEEQQSVLADTTSEQTDWIDIPNEAGWETIAANCSVECTDC